MRVYVPSTLPALAGALEEGEVRVREAYAVTPALTEAYASGDQEELEYVAMSAAARASLRLLAADPRAASRRVVLAAEVAAATWSGDHADPARVALNEIIPVAKLVSAHVDDPQAVDDVKAAVAALPAAEAGDEDAEFAVDQAEGHELAWFAAQELPHLTQ
jgi:hypothetical protein